MYQILTNESLRMDLIKKSLNQKLKSLVGKKLLKKLGKSTEKVLE